MEISIVIPVFNEEDNIRPLYEELKKVLNNTKSYEIIFVDDGSTDRTFEILKRIRKKDNNLKVIKLRKNFGQTAAISAGIDYSKGKILVFMDGDMQNDPRDIPKLIKEIKQGSDVVSGWRHDRKDSVSKRLFSKISNSLAKNITGVPIHDFGCTLKAYRREAIEELKLYGEMHRYIPALLAWDGFTITEVKVNHRKRKHGETKYSTSRLLNGFLDLINIKFLIKYSNKPMYFFGIIGMILLFLGFLSGVYLIFLKFAYNITLGDRPLLLLSILLIILGIQFITFGFFSSMILKTYYNNPNNKTYKVKTILK